MLSDFRQPDLHAPRFRPKALNLLNTTFFEKVREQKELKHLTNEQIKHIVVTGNQVLQDIVLSNRNGVDLPEQLGHLFLGATPPTRHRNVDYKKSLELGKTVHHKNWETDGLTCKIFYSNFHSRYRFRFHEVWMVDAVRQLQKAASDTFRKDHQKFVLVDNLAKIGHILRKRKRTEQVIQQQVVRLEDYDEFDLD